MRSSEAGSQRLVRMLKEMMVEVCRKGRRVEEDMAMVQTWMFSMRAGSVYRSSLAVMCVRRECKKSERVLRKPRNSGRLEIRG